MTKKQIKCIETENIIKNSNNIIVWPTICDYIVAVIKNNTQHEYKS